MTIDTEQLYFILDNTPSAQNIMLVGRHGIGKSRILEEYYNKKGCKVVTLFLGQMSDPGDLIGLPEKDEKHNKTDFMLPYWFPTDNTPIVLFLDELNRARPEVLQTIMDLTLNRKLAGKSLPEGSRIISAVNNGSEYQLTDLDPALISRFNIYEFSPSVKDWLIWANDSLIDNRIIDFIEQNPEYLDGSFSSVQTDSFERIPDRRSWERTSDIIKNFTELNNSHKPIVAGIIGSIATASFFSFVSENNIPGAKSLLLEDFASYKEKLKTLSIPMLTKLSSSVFNFLESKNYDDTDVDIISNNLLLYFNFLSSYSKEGVSFFASLWSSSQYPKALSFIAEHSISLYKALMNELNA